MTNTTLEQLLAVHCAPTLLGQKSASLISLPRSAGLERVVREYNRQLAPVVLLPICECNQRLLLLVCRPALMEESLAQPERRALLSRLGYPAEGSPAALLRHLRTRFTDAGFPHEIGLFLDYPVCDVEGFMLYRGEGCKLCGYWKVYGDVEEAQKRFASYDSCRAYLCRGLSAGRTIAQLLPAA